MLVLVLVEQFTGDDAATVEASASKSLSVFCELTGVDADGLVETLTTRRIEAPGMSIKKPVTPDVVRLWFHFVAIMQLL